MSERAYGAEQEESVSIAAGPPFATDDDRWAAVTRRDGRADGRFYYSVRTTGVYCRPTCGGRPARRENVRFHQTRDDAERAGFRPCKRCRPDEPPLGERRALAVAAACRTIQAAEEVPTLDQLAAAAGMSPFHFHRIFKTHLEDPRARVGVPAAGCLTSITPSERELDHGGYSACRPPPHRRSRPNV